MTYFHATTDASDLYRPTSSADDLYRPTSAAGSERHAGTEVSGSLSDVMKNRTIVRLVVGSQAVNEVTPPVPPQE